MSFTELEIQAILALLSDSDPDIVAGMRQKLFEIGETAVRHILSLAPDGSRAQREAGRVLRRFRESPLEEQFRRLSVDETGDINLEEGAFILAKFAYPDLDVSAYKTRLGRMAFELAPQVAPDDHPLRVIHTLNTFMFKTQGFWGPRQFDPDDTYLNRVMDRKRGSPITIAAVYILLARRLELPIFGIAMPKHFIAKYRGKNGETIYIDPYHHGQILTPAECSDMVGMNLTDDLLPEITDRFILFRMMNNLVNTYLYQADEKRAERLKGLIQILQKGQK